MLTLDIWAGDDLVGKLTHVAETNQFAFGYAPRWLAFRWRFALSPTIPLEAPTGQTSEQHSAQVRQFFENLLPEGEALDHAAQAAGVAKSNLAALLISLGKETAGALRVTVDDSAQTGSGDLQGRPKAAGPGLPEPEMRLITREQLSERIKNRAEQPFSVWDGKVRLSIAGYQDKIAVYERDGKWYLVNGQRLASTVIVKPAPVRPQLSELPANEFMCMQLAQRVGVETAATRLVHVPEPVLLVQRFDRIEDEHGVRRLHIIDGCQALGLSVSMKYERAYGDGQDVAHLREGASLPKLFGLLDKSPEPAADKRALLRWVAFQVLIGNTDAHGKNISFYCDSRGLKLAPAYDMVCLAALGAGLQSTYAMAIGDAFTEAELTPYEWAHFAYQCGLPSRLVARELQSIALRVLDVMDDVIRDVVGQGVPPAVAQRLQTEINTVCVRQSELAPKIATFKTGDFT